MPRISPALLKKAWNIDHLLPLLVRQCRDLSSARNELRWIKEFVTSSQRKRPIDNGYNEQTLHSLCQKRARGHPLQYLLGTQPFGHLEMLCKKKVLIPRPETESYTAHLADFVFRDAALSNQNELNILDLCTGTGAISLLLHSLLYQQFESLNGLGVDISEAAVALARKNVFHNAKAIQKEELPYHNLGFAKADILDEEFTSKLESWGVPNWDIVIANPPYISQSSYWKDTSRSARLFEPLEALVPSVSNGVLASPYLLPEDLFYPRILELSVSVDAQVVVMEVADLEQALRVSRHAHTLRHFDSVEIWRDWPQSGELDVLQLDDRGTKINVYGTGNGRTVVCKV